MYHNIALALLNRIESSFHSVALSYMGEDLSFGNLGELALRAAGALEERNSSVQRPIGIWGDKSPEAFAGMLACLLRGQAYFFIDPGVPAERLSNMVRATRCQTLIGPQELTGVWADCEDHGHRGVTFISASRIRRSAPASRTEIESNAHSIDGSTIVYYMFTSGSTGTPKAVGITHSNLSSFKEWGRKRFNVEESDVLAQASPLFFDNSVFDIFVGLMNGATLAVVTADELERPDLLVPLMEKLRPTIWFSVPSIIIYLRVLGVFNKTVFPNLSSIVFGGEGFPKALLKEVFTEFAEQADLINVYGPTECTCIATTYNVSADDFELTDNFLPLGHLNENFDFVLDFDEPDCDRGELILMGPNVGAGYAGADDVTAGRFFQYSDGHRLNKPAYRTGDIVSLVGEMLHFHGRLDNQVKHLGHRIELEEIEQAINSHSSILESCVVHIKKREEFGVLVAVVVCKSKPALTDVKNLREFLEKKLPAYMVPRDYLDVDLLPKNANGKTDRFAVGQLARNIR